MATTYGVTPEGFRRKTVDEIITSFEASQLSTMYDDLDVSSESVVGQLNGIVGNELGSSWEALEQLYQAGDVDASEDRTLENLCKLLGIYRGGVTYGTVTLLCDLVVGTTLVAGTHFAAVTEQPDIRWTPSADYTATYVGWQPVVFRAELGGPISAVAGTIGRIATPIVGWNGVSQPSDADPGDLIETNAKLRARRSLELAKLGSATLIAIKASISSSLAAAGQTVDTLSVYENDGDVTDIDSRPPHSVEVIIFDGDPAPVGNDAIIAQAMVDAGLSGVQTYGNVSATAMVLQGTQTVAKTVRFTRVTVVPIVVQFTLTKGPNYPGDAAIRAYVLAQANAFHKPGDDVSWTYLVGLAHALGGVAKVTSVFVNLVSQGDVVIGLRETARFSSAGILIVST